MTQAPRIDAEHGPPLIQEYIPGGDRTSIQFVLDKSGAVVVRISQASGSARSRRTAQTGHGVGVRASR